jgi:hypothetical protein
MSTSSSASRLLPTSRRATSSQASNLGIPVSQAAISLGLSSQSSGSQTTISPTAPSATTSAEPVSTANISRRETIAASPQPSRTVTQTLNSSPSKEQRDSNWAIAFRAFGVRLFSTWRSSHSRQDIEQKKIILDRSFRRALIRCAVHFLPVSASITLTVLNLRGYFIGATFQGLTSVSDAVDTLILQVTAKLMVCVLPYDRQTCGGMNLIHYPRNYL